MDVNGDGSIERSNLLGLGARILVGFGEAPTSTTGSNLVQGFGSVWQALSAEIDAAGDRAISSEEFRAGMTAAFIEGDRFDTVFGPAAEAFAELCDTNG